MISNRHAVFDSRPQRANRSRAVAMAAAGAGEPAVGPLPGDPVALRACVHVAAEVVPLLVETVEDQADRVTIVADIVACWRCLPAGTRQAYAARRGPAGGLLHFAGEYVDAVDRRAAATGRGEDRERADAAARRVWREHVAEALARRSHRRPPPAAWLDRFPLGG